jgi:ABC-2 type transport system permease protein
MDTMAGDENKIGDWVRIVMAVAGKDVVDAIKNRVTISIILGVAMVVLSTQVLPLAMKLRADKNALVFDASGSNFVEEFGRGGSFRLIKKPSREAMMEEMRTVVSGTIGLELSADFDVALEGNGPLEMEVYFSHAMRGSEIEDLKEFFSRELGDAVGRDIVLTSEGNELFPGPEAGGHPFMVSITLVISIMVVGMSLVPLLMIEEKEKHTIEVLMISPASYGQVVLGKAVAGVFYCVTAAAVVFAINFQLLATGWVALLAVVAAALFTVGLGLLFGVLFEQPANMNMVMGLVMILLMLPALLSALTSSSLPAAVQAVLPYIPSVAAGKLFSMSFSNIIDANVLFLNLGVLLGTAIVLLLLVIWRVRRMDR